MDFHRKCQSFPNRICIIIYLQNRFFFTVEGGTHLLNVLMNHERQELYGKHVIINTEYQSAAWRYMVLSVKITAQSVPESNMTQ